MTKRMTNKRRTPVVLIITGIIAAMLGSALAQQDPIQTKPGPISFGKPTEIVMNQAASANIDLRKLPQTKPVKQERPEREEPAVERTAIEQGPVPPPEVTTPSVPAQNAPAPSPLISFDGLDFANWGAG